VGLSGIVKRLLSFFSDARHSETGNTLAKFEERGKRAMKGVPFSPESTDDDSSSDEASRAESEENPDDNDGN